MTDNRVGKRIQEYRLKAGISQEKLAETLDLSVTSISNIERGENYPSLETFIKLVNAIGVSADQVLEDVLENVHFSESNELSEMISNASNNTKKKIFAVIKALIDTEN